MFLYIQSFPQCFCPKCWVQPFSVLIPQAEMLTAKSFCTFSLLGPQCCLGGNISFPWLLPLLLFFLELKWGLSCGVLQPPPQYLFLYPVGSEWSLDAHSPPSPSLPHDCSEFPVGKFGPHFSIFPFPLLQFLPRCPPAGTSVWWVSRLAMIVSCVRNSLFNYSCFICCNFSRIISHAAILIPWFCLKDLVCFVLTSDKVIMHLLCIYFF